MSSPSSAFDPSEPPRSEDGIVPAAGDNVAIATRRLEAGTVLFPASAPLPGTILEGHRFAVRPISEGEKLLSWGMPFGIALRDIEPGEYVCNSKVLRALDGRVPFSLPATPNFRDYSQPFELEPGRFRAGEQVERVEVQSCFQGFRREGGRGTGTRNYILLIGTTSRTASFARRLAEDFQNVPEAFPNVDGVVAISHTECGEDRETHNHQLTCKTLAGFMVHPNVGAALLIDFGNESLSNDHVKRFLREHAYPTEGLLHGFFRVEQSFEASLERARGVVQGWLPRVNAMERTAVPVSELKLGLQCGGSDAFSGISANPLVGILSREIVARGGSANLAETDELIGAESYVLANVRNLWTAEQFLARVERFKKWAFAHGHTAEGNPSGGNIYRGLYNIAIKSIGAARKKDPATRLDHVIDYGERMGAPGFYFMDSPGNDLESIAGQVAAGCNLILFATGNGSITNFPFVPTIKIMTTTARFELVRNEMDFNAGRYLDGEALEDLGSEAFEQMVAIASGRKSAGEKAGHSQVQLWREWRNQEIAPRTGSGTPVFISERTTLPNIPADVQAWLAAAPAMSVDLVLPTSLCSGEIARMIAHRLNSRTAVQKRRAVALPHTEGCGNSGGESERLFLRTMAGYLAHPLVRKALLLEHGCEKTHNDAFRRTLREMNLPAESFGWASIQLDGGLERVTQKVLQWFGQEQAETSHIMPLSVAFYGVLVPESVAEELGLVFQMILAMGGDLIVPTNSTAGELVHFKAQPLRYGERISGHGFHVMECPTADPIETITGLGATGATLILAYSDIFVVPGHPMIPTIRVCSEAMATPIVRAEADCVLLERPGSGEGALGLIKTMAQTRNGMLSPKSWTSGNTAFQITRGVEGISL